MKNKSWLKQIWTIAKIELRRAFFSKRAFWVYGLALFPSLIFFGYSIQIKFRRAHLSSNGLIKPALMDSIHPGETVDAILKRLGNPPTDYEWPTYKRVPAKGGNTGITSHLIDPPVEARFIRLNIIVPTNTFEGQPSARIYELEVYGDEAVNLALNRPATGSAPCSPDQGPEKAFNGSVKGGITDRWCSNAPKKFLQVDLGRVIPIKRVVVKHASAGGENVIFNTRAFNIQASLDDKVFVTFANEASAGFADEITLHRGLSYFDGQREARLEFVDGKLVSKNFNTLINFEEDRKVFAAVFQFFYLRLAIFFGCLGIFMNLFRGEMLDKTLHFWFLAPARREVLLAGKYCAGLIASIIIFAGGAFLCFQVLMLIHDSVQVQAYWHSAGFGHLFWYMAASILGCIGYGSVFLAAGLLMRNPIIPAAVLLGWEAINGFLPEILQRLSVLYYLQSLCPVPVPIDESTPALLKLLLVPAEPASRVGAILGLVVVTGVVLWIACISIRRMQVSYSTET